MNLKLRSIDSSLFVGKEIFLRKVFKCIKLSIFVEKLLNILLKLSVFTILKSLCVFLIKWRSGGKGVLFELNVVRCEICVGFSARGRGGLSENLKKLSVLGILRILKELDLIWSIFWILIIMERKGILQLVRLLDINFFVVLNSHLYLERNDKNV